MYTDDEIEKSIRKKFNQLRGRLLGFLEAVGMPDRQEEGAKQTLKTLSYEIENQIVDLVLGELEPEDPQSA